MIEFAVAGLTEPVNATVPWLSLSILFPIVGALLVPFIPDSGNGRQVRWYSLGITLVTFLITVAAYLNGYDPSLSGLQLAERVSWLPDLGLTWAVGADGLSMPLILLTSFITTLACLAAWPVSFKPKLFYFLLLATGCSGVLLVRMRLCWRADRRAHGGGGFGCHRRCRRQRRQRWHRHGWWRRRACGLVVSGSPAGCERAVALDLSFLGRLATHDSSGTAAEEASATVSDKHCVVRDAAEGALPMVNRAATDGEAAHVLARASDQLHRAALTKRQFCTRCRCDRVSGEWRRDEKSRECPHERGYPR